MIHTFWKLIKSSTGSTLAAAHDFLRVNNEEINDKCNIVEAFNTHLTNISLITSSSFSVDADGKDNMAIFSSCMMNVFIFHLFPRLRFITP